LSDTADSQDLNFHLGLAVWAYKDWLGNFFPPKSRATDFLRLYSERLTTVEGNTTFYSIPSPAMVQRWARETPSTFRFCPKLPRQFTHQGKLAPHLPAALEFLDLMKGLGARLGPLFAQLPPSYSPAALPDLARFLTDWPRQTAPLAVEVRHLDWFKEPQATQLNALLTRLGVGRVMLDTRPIYDWEDAAEDPQLQSERRKPQVPLQVVATAPFVLVRYISHPDIRRNQAYLAQWVEQVGQWLATGRQVYFFVHCPLEERSPAIATDFHTQLTAAKVPIPPLPWDAYNNPPEQLSLF
jgi:uncharacterized protein YecE (DUF72 family)